MTQMITPRVKPQITPRQTTPTVQQRIVKLLAELDASLIERQDETRLTMTAVVAQSTLLLVGPPGTGKSFTLESIFRAVSDGGKPFTWLMGKFTEPDEIFGPTDILALKGGVRRRVTKGKLPEATAVFLDEFFKASTAIANTLLRIVNEKVYDNGDGEMNVPLRALVAASNEYPQDGELGAMFDRFVLRKPVDYVQSATSRSRLLRSMDHTPKTTVSITLVELDQAHAEAMTMEVPDEIWALVDRIVEELIVEGVRPSDRRLPLVGKILRAYAYVQGASVVKAEHLEVLNHMLWNDPQEQPLKVAKVVARIANPIGMIINDLLQHARKVLANSAPAQATVELKQIQGKLSVMREDPRREVAMAWVESELRRLYNLGIGITV